MFTRALLLLILLSLLGGCYSWQPYDPDHPERYERYWNKKDNRKDSILYQFTDEAQEDSLEKKCGDEWRKNN